MREREESRIEANKRRVARDGSGVRGGLPAGEKSEKRIEEPQSGSENATDQGSESLRASREVEKSVSRVTLRVFAYDFKSFGVTMRVDVYEFRRFVVPCVCW